MSTLASIFVIYMFMCVCVCVCVYIYDLSLQDKGFPGGSVGKESACNAVVAAGSIPGWGRSLEEGMAIHSSIIAWRILWTEEPGGLQSIRLQRVGHD